MVRKRKRITIRRVHPSPKRRDVRQSDGKRRFPSRLAGGFPRKWKCGKKRKFKGFRSQKNHGSRKTQIMRANEDRNSLWDGTGKDIRPRFKTRLGQKKNYPFRPERN